MGCISGVTKLILFIFNLVLGCAALASVVLLGFASGNAILKSHLPKTTIVALGVTIGLMLFSVIGMVIAAQRSKAINKCVLAFYTFLSICFAVAFGIGTIYLFVTTFDSKEVFTECYLSAGCTYTGIKVSSVNPLGFTFLPGNSTSVLCPSNKAVQVLFSSQLNSTSIVTGSRYLNCLNSGPYSAEYEVLMAGVWCRLQDGFSYMLDQAVSVGRVVSAGTGGLLLLGVVYGVAVLCSGGDGDRARREEFKRPSYYHR